MLLKINNMPLLLIVAIITINYVLMIIDVSIREHKYILNRILYFSILSKSTYVDFTLIRMRQSAHIISNSIIILFLLLIFTIIFVPINEIKFISFNEISFNVKINFKAVKCLSKFL